MRESVNLYTMNRVGKTRTKFGKSRLDKRGELDSNWFQPYWK